MTNALPQPVNDGLPTPEVGGWAEDKYRIHWLYATLFSSGMKKKWGQRVYIDLYSGAGQVRIRGTGRLLYGSPLLALQVRDPFDKYIFCEENHELIKALKIRVKRISPNADVSFIEGDCDLHVEQILSAIPAASKERTVLNLCFVDPFNLGLRFETLAALAARFTDFLVLLAVYMDANRNYEPYVAKDSTKVADFLGDPQWRTNWQQSQAKGVPFPKFLSTEFAARMATLGYRPTEQMQMVRSDEKNSPLYYLAIFSRSSRAYEFWDEVLKYRTAQRTLEFDGS